MQPLERDVSYLWDMLDSAKKISRMVHGRIPTDIQEDEMLLLALERLLEIIGEAARRVSKTFQEAHTEIPWVDIIGMRNRLIHEYFEIDLGKVCDTVFNDISSLIAQLEPLIPSE